MATAYPKVMKAWHHTSIPRTKTVEEVLNFSPNFPSPPTPIPRNHLLIRVHYAALNPADIKLPESFLTKIPFLFPYPSIPGHDFSGVVVASNIPSSPSSKSPNKRENSGEEEAEEEFNEGTRVFGAMNGIVKYGSLGEFIVVPKEVCVVVPTGVKMEDAAALGCAAQTALQSFPASIVREGSRVLINGGSGGLGTFGIQIAKAMGAHVTAVCSTGNMALCKELGADEVLDYKGCDIQETLEGMGEVFDLVVDNIGYLDFGRCGRYLKRGGLFQRVGIGLEGRILWGLVRDLLMPAWMGGGERAFAAVTYSSQNANLKKLGDMMREGKLRAVVEDRFEMGDAKLALARLRSGRTRGKILVHVDDETD